MSKRNKKKSTQKQIKKAGTRSGAESTGKLDSKRTLIFWSGLALMTGAVAFGVLAADRSKSEQEKENAALGVLGSGPAAETPAVQTPPYYPSAEAGRPFPETIPFWKFDDPITSRAYQIAQAIPEVLVQQPCYCWCDGMGHGSLLSCFASAHASG